METVRRLNADGVAAVYGDASRAETLKGAGIEQARSLILSRVRHEQQRGSGIRVARDLNPKRPRILARAVSTRGRFPALRRGGRRYAVCSRPKGEVRAGHDRGDPCAAWGQRPNRSTASGNASTQTCSAPKSPKRKGLTDRPTVPRIPI